MSVAMDGKNGHNYNETWKIGANVFLIRESTTHLIKQADQWPTSVALDTLMLIGPGVSTSKTVLAR